MTKGIITIATKHPLYGVYAYNLAVSLRAMDAVMPISIIADQVGLSMLDDYQKTVFDRIITPDLCDYYDGEKCTPLTLKYHLHKYSPYECTIFADADTIFSPMANIHGVFSSLQGIPFTIASRGEQEPNKGVSEWVESGVIDAPYWYDISSEFIYFEKSDIACAVFDNALRHYKAGDLRTKVFAGDKPDEPFIMLGMIEAGVRPHQAVYKPSYWYASEKGFKNAMDVKRGYLMMSLGGKFIPRQQQLIYDEICRNVSYLTGRKTMKVSHKMNKIAERKVI
jgi:hypothetical protein